MWAEKMNGFHKISEFKAISSKAPNLIINLQSYKNRVKQQIFGIKYHGFIHSIALH